MNQIRERWLTVVSCLRKNQRSHSYPGRPARELYEAARFFLFSARYSRTILTASASLYPLLRASRRMASVSAMSSAISRCSRRSSASNSLGCFFCLRACFSKFVHSSDLISISRVIDHPPPHNLSRLRCINVVIPLFIENHMHAVALHYIHYNFVRIHESPR